MEDGSISDTLYAIRGFYYLTDVSLIGYFLFIAV